MSSITTVLRAGWLAFASACVWYPFCVSAQGTAPVESERITLRAALERAFVQNPQIEIEDARLDEVHAGVVSARAWPLYPVLETSWGERRSAGATSEDVEVALGIELEIAGQRRRRIQAARAAVAAQDGIRARQRRLLAARVHMTFIDALEARDLLRIAEADLSVAERLHTLAERRLERGAATQLDANLAASQRGRAESGRQEALARFAAARARLGELTGELDPSALPEPDGSLQTELNTVPPLPELVRTAAQRRADLTALREMERAARAEQRLARSESWPTLSVQAFQETEAGTDTIRGVRLSLPIPLFNRNQGARARARATVRRAEYERRRGELRTSREIVETYANYQARLKSAERLRVLVLGKLEQNQTLLQRSLDSGKATLPEIMLIQRSLMASQAELTSAEADARRGWIELRVAAGQMPLPQPTEQEERQ